MKSCFVKEDPKKIPNTLGSDKNFPDHAKATTSIRRKGVNIIAVGLLILPLASCTTAPSKSAPAQCAGANDLPAEYTEAFQETVDNDFLARAIGKVDGGGLCQGKVYISKTDASFPIYRAWNSNNPNSRLGKWWAFYKPEGKIGQYRENYEICYQWSPLDKMTFCKLKANTKVVVGTGQSAACDAYLTYPVSATKQIYIEIDAKSPSVTDCKDHDGAFNWIPSAAPFK